MSRLVGLYNENGDVVNTIEYDGRRNYTPPDGLTIIDDQNSNIGDTVVDGVLVKAVQVPQTDTRTTEERIRSEYVDTTTMLEAAFKQFKAMEDSGVTLEPETRAVLDNIEAAEIKHR